MSWLTVERAGPIKRLVLNRPEKRNALSLALATELQHEVELSETDGTRLLVLRGAGPGFCAGFDFSAFPACSEGDLLLHFVRIELMLQAVAHCSIDTLALVHGQTLGAGADLALACRHRVGAADTKMLFPGARFGLVLGSRRLAHCVGADQAQGLIGGMERIDAQQAKTLGLLNDVLEPALWAEHEAQVLAHVMATPADARALILRAIRPDTRAQDLTDLVKSAAAADIKQRLTAYLGQTPAAAKKIAAS
ncbi:MAG: enoyl-CoA hydratase/isomerase family protein [Burkholderiaceae bacterium]